MSVVQFPHAAVSKGLLRYFVGRIGRPDNICNFPDFDMRPMDRAEQILAFDNMNFVPHRLGDGHTHSMNRKPKNVGHFYNRFGDTTSHSQPLLCDLLMAVLAVGSPLSCNKYFVSVRFPTLEPTPYCSGVLPGGIRAVLQ